jgi:FkbM family methyltransferase
MIEETLHPLPAVAQATLQGPNGPIPFHLFKTDVCFQIANDIFAGITYPLVPFVSCVKTIFDIGANVGAASVYFATAYPDAQIYAFEPGSIPLELLKTNMEPMGRVTVLPFGLYSNEKRLPLFQGKNDSVESSVCLTARTVCQGEETRLVCTSQFLSERGIEGIDILKIDTEGCEVPILQSLGRYLPEVKVLYIEYHSERDRRIIDGMLAETHVLWKGQVRFAYRGEFCYLRRDLVPDQAETHTCEILLNLD